MNVRSAMRIAMVAPYIADGPAGKFVSDVCHELATAIDSSLRLLRRGSVTVFGSGEDSNSIRKGRAQSQALDPCENENIYRRLTAEGRFDDFNLVHAIGPTASALEWCIRQARPVVCTLAIPEHVSYAVDILRALPKGRVLIATLPGLEPTCVGYRLPLSVDLERWRPAKTPGRRVIWITPADSSGNRGGIPATELLPRHVATSAKAIISRDVPASIAYVVGARLVAAGVSGFAGDANTPTQIEAESIQVNMRTLSKALRVAERRRYALAHFGRSAVAAAYRRLYDAAINALV